MGLGTLEGHLDFSRLEYPSRLSYVGLFWLFGGDKVFASFMSTSKAYVPCSLV